MPILKINKEERKTRNSQHTRGQPMMPMKEQIQQLTYKYYFRNRGGKQEGERKESRR